MSLSFFSDLFTVEGATAGTVIAYLPYLITAILLGVVLASVYFTFWRAVDTKLVKRLHEAGATSAQDAKTLGELGYRPGFFEKLLRFLLRSHACMVYKNISSDERDAQHLAYLRQEGEVSDPDGDTPTDTDSPSTVLIEESETDVSPKTAAADCADAEQTLAVDTETSTPAAEKKAARRKKLRPRTRMKVAPETRFYIVPTRIEYVEGHELTYSGDDVWGLLFTLAGSILLWLGALALLDPLANFLMK